ncbi:NAD(P)H-binding protein [Mycolicibacterium sp. 018/SC-01/001]|uniref:NAD(P)H-binding protein n=1 Tax=Mycolicibacterium sp. 018/SC-01/001 TaxID=2592069 RepID=UPI0021025C8E|nr:NAD(P)H-binding protein [Mycolicibacterium sp. 018/SC-01/001]
MAPILVTGAAGEVGSVGAALVHRIVAAGRPVRAFVRTDDRRAEVLRQAGAEIFVGDLLNVADVNAALQGCRRVYFSMSLNPYYVDATILIAAAAKAQGRLEVLVNISESEQTNLTYERLIAPHSERVAWLGGGVSQWSPQQRAHWAAEQALDWSGLPVVHIRAGIFVENPILSWFPMAELVASGELRLPFGEARLAPIAGADVAEVCATILIDPQPHVGRTYTLIGPELKTMAEYAEDYAAAFHRPVSYVAQDLETWNRSHIDAALADSKPHNAEHLKTLTRLVASGRYYDVEADDLAALLGRPPKTLRWALEHYPHAHELLRQARTAP